MSTDCERWAEIGDRRLVDEPISDEDERFFREHEETCALCRAEAEAWSALPAYEETDSLSKPDADALVERAIAVAHKQPEAKKLPLRNLDEARKRRSPVLIPAIAAALAIAAGYIFLLNRPAARPGPTVAELSSATGDVRVDGASAQSGAPLREGARLAVGPGARACIGFDSGKIKSCLDSNSEIVVARGKPSDRTLALVSGTVVTALEKLPAGDTFAVEAARHSVTVTGTVFSVSASTVRVHEGAVRIGSSGGETWSISEGRQLDLAQHAEAAVAPAERSRDLEIVGVTLPRAVGAATSKPSESAAKLDEPLAPPPPSAPTPAPEASAKPPSPSEMLEAARKLRAGGDAGGAAEAYRKLMAAHPKSAEARASLVSIAELQLGPLGDPAGALRSYDGYLKSGGGALTQEARYGRISALRRLGRTAEERAAIEEFVNAYPSSVQARALKARLGESSTP